MRYVLDTNIVLAYLRKHTIWNLIEEPFEIYDSETIVFVPAVVIGKLESIAVQNDWGQKKKQDLEVFVNEFIRVDQLNDEIITAYSKIDAFSQGRLEGKPLNDSARNMGKNDLWIAATASILDATLITTDKDFQHLHTHFLDVAYFDLNKN